ncbi:MAG: helix-turn-helix domain containing protein [Clostridium sp.]|jgi:transcriptional regulator with XRE-family HTH domain|nr:helix-turn-helix domain containing protein [Clostridium sp.]
MAVSSKIKALLKLKNRENIALAEHLGITNQALSNKLYRGSFSAEDLIKIAAFLDCELAFILSDAQKITLDTSDIRQDENKPLPVGKAAESEG